MHKAVLWSGGPQLNLLKMSIFDHEVSNKTRYGIENDAWRYTWAGYYLFVILSSLIGDSTILVASMKYIAIKLHKVIVTIIQHIAVCDLLVVVFDISLKLAPIIANRWNVGQFLCYVNVFAYNYVSPSSILLICTMTTCKLLLVKYPLRLGPTSTKKAHLLCGACWVLALVPPVTKSLVDWADVSFSYVLYNCVYGYSSEIWKYLHNLLNLFGFLPICLVVATSVYLLVIAKQVAERERESLKWQGIITTVLTAAVYCISVLPLVVIGSRASIVGYDGFFDNSKDRTIFRIANSFIYLNTISNFYIYCLTVTSFRSFVWSRLELVSKIFGFSFFRGKHILQFRKLLIYSY